MNQPKVSVIIPVYNTEKYLRECLDSVVNQTLKDIEIICVDDGSTDGSLTILEKHREKDPRITVFTQPNSGQSAARNTGMRYARGEYIYFIDSDDLIELNTLEKAARVASDNDLDIITFEQGTFYETEQLKQLLPVRYKHMSEATGIISGVQYMKALRDQGIFAVSVCIALWRRDFLKEHGIIFKEGIIHEDNLFQFQAFMAAERVMRITETLYYRRVRADSTMTSPKSAKNVIGFFTCTMGVLEYALNNSGDQLKEQQIGQEYNRILGEARRYYNAIADEEREKVFFSSEIENALFNHLVKDWGRLDASNKQQKQQVDRLLRDLDGKKKEADTLRRDLDGKKKEADTLRYDLDCVHSSVSFRVGRGITYLPRKLRDISIDAGKEVPINDLKHTDTTTSENKER